MATMDERSAFFFIGRLMPAELANFNVQNVFVRDRRNGQLELLGNGIAIWWPTRPRREFVDLADSARAWFRTTASAYYLQTGVPLEPELTGWVEALHVEARQAVIGFADPRFVKVSTPPEDAEVNEQMRTAIQLASRLRRKGGEIERATHQALAAANDGTPQAFLSAFRALECVRRIYEPRWAHRAAGWTRMAADLSVRLAPEKELLEETAKAVRHGDIPSRQSALHVVNRARRRRADLLEYTRSLVLAAAQRHA
jgi:hypothetical protein